MNEGWSWAEETGAGVLLIRHLIKASGGNPLCRDGSSIGIIAARSVPLVARHPDNDRRRGLVSLKNNPVEPTPPLRCSPYLRLRREVGTG